MSDVEGSNSGSGSDFDPDGEPDLSPIRPTQIPQPSRSNRPTTSNAATSSSNTNSRRTATPTTTANSNSNSNAAASGGSGGTRATEEPKTPPPKRGRPRKGTVPDHPINQTPSNALTSKPPAAASSPTSPTSPTTSSSTRGQGAANHGNSNHPNQSTQANSTTQSQSQSQSQSSQSQAPSQAQMMPQGYLAMGPGGLPILLQNPPGNVNPGDRTQLYALLRQMPFGGLRSADGAQGNGVGTAPLPFPFPMHPGLLAGAAMSNDPIPSAHDAEAPPGEGPDSPGKSPAPLGGGMMGSPSKSRPTPGTLEWARQRKDNHKEVERRRRGNINEGINELARLIPIGQGDKAKGAVLSRAVQYITQLKDAEQRNVEKWTMEKLTNDSVVEDWRRRFRDLEDRYDRERERREELEVEVGRLRKLLGLGAFQATTASPIRNPYTSTGNGAGASASAASAAAHSQSSSAVGTSRNLEHDEDMDVEEDELEEDEDGAEEYDERPPKRLRVS